MSFISNEILTFNQGDGPSIKLRVLGDEFYAIYETLDGYSVIYDYHRGCFVYADESNGQLVSTGVKATLKPPKDLDKHIRESEEISQQKFGLKYNKLRVPQSAPGFGRMRTLGEPDGLLYGRRIHTGNVCGLTVLVEFKDEQFAPNMRDHYDEMLNHNNFSSWGNHCSVKSYFEKMSSNKLVYTNDVIGPIRLPGTKEYYKSNPVIMPALNQALAEYEFNFALYDSRGVGEIDAISIVYAGRTEYVGDLWPHNHFILNQDFEGYRPFFYTIQSGGRLPQDATIGTFCHESGHMLCRFPDLYDYGNRDNDSLRSAGLGAYCLMSSGNHNDGGRTPSAISAYLRLLAGWDKNVVDLKKGEVYTLAPEDYGTIYRHKTNKPNEFFLIENRPARGLDAHLPDTGLAVYHCDILGSNEWQQGTATRHYQTALLQADGRRDLEQVGYYSNRGDENDLFGEPDEELTGVFLDNMTTPGTRQWDGRDSGLTLRDLERTNETIKFAIGQQIKTEDGLGEDDKVANDQLIPGDKAEALTFQYKLKKVGKIADIKIEGSLLLPANHPVKVTLGAPSGETADIIRFKRSTAGPLKFAISFSSLSRNNLKKFSGCKAKGTWTLSFAATKDGEISRLDSLRVDFSLEE